MVTVEEIEHVSKLMKIDVDDHIEYLDKVKKMISYFDILQTIAVFHIVILLILKGNVSIKNIRIPNSLRFLTNLFFVTVLITQFAGIGRYFILVDVYTYEMAVGNIMENFANPFYSLIVFIGLCVFIIDYKKVERLLGIFFLAGLLLLIEHFILVYLGMFESLNFWAYASDGKRFSSLIYQNYDVKSRSVFL